MDIIDKAIGLFLIGALVPAAITSITATNTTGWGATNIVLWGLVSMLAIIGLFKWVTQ